MLAVLIVSVAADCQKYRSPFLVKPYLQLGTDPSTRSLLLLWQTPDRDAAAWAVEARAGSAWYRMAPPSARRLFVEKLGWYRAYEAVLAAVPPGQIFTYRVLRNGQEVFVASAHARKSAEQPYRFALFGDCADGSDREKEVAYQAYRTAPDFVLIPGDIVYPRGLGSEYRLHFFPIYNAERPSPRAGAPLLRSVPFIACPGNHDIGISVRSQGNFNAYPDALAYFTFFAQPLNGPQPTRDPLSSVVLTGPTARRQAFQEAAGKRFPRMANFSFDYGNAHWTLLDSNHYRDWTDKELQRWIRDDLESARDATWRFVAFHHPPFHSSREHADDQWMRVLVPLFQQERVDIVFCGHVHNYERSRPLTFHPSEPTPPRPPRRLSAKAARRPPVDVRHVPGTFDIDREFDGRIQTHPRGILYLVSGAGGAELYDPEVESQPASWRAYTEKFVARTNSFTEVEVNGGTLNVHQIAVDGKAVDEFTVTKP